MKQPLRRLVYFATLCLVGLLPTASFAQLFVDSAIGNDSYDGSSPTVGVFPVGPKETVSGAMAIATPGIQINLAAGTYAGFAVTVSDVRIVGPNDGISPNTPGDITTPNPARVPEAIVVGAVQVLAPNVALRGISFTNTANITLSATPNGASGLSLVANRFVGYASGSVLANTATNPQQNFNISDNRIESGVATEVAFSLSRITGMNVIAANYIADWRGGASLTDVVGLVFSSNHLANHGDYGLLLADSTGNALVGNNTFANCNTNNVANGGGVLLQRPRRFKANVLIQNNLITGCYHGVCVAATPTPADYPNTLSTLSIRHNSFEATVPGSQAIRTTTTIIPNPLPCSGNWFGTADINNIHNILVTSNRVDYTPYLGLGTNLATGTGFIPVFTEVWAARQSSQLGADSRLEEALALVDVGGTLFLTNGTFGNQAVDDETFVVNKYVKIVGTVAANGTPTSILRPNTATVGMRFDVSGVDASNRIEVSHLLIGNTTDGVLLPPSTSHIEFTNVRAGYGATNAGQNGFRLQAGGTYSDVVLNNCQARFNANAGFLVEEGVLSASDITLTGGSFTSNLTHGIYISGSPLLPAGNITGIVVTNAAIGLNGSQSTLGSSLVTLRYFNGDAVLADLNATNAISHYGVNISGWTDGAGTFAPMGSVVLNNVDLVGSFADTLTGELGACVAISGYNSNLAGLSITGGCYWQSRNEEAAGTFPQTALFLRNLPAGTVNLDDTQLRIFGNAGFPMVNPVQTPNWFIVNQNPETGVNCTGCQFRINNVVAVNTSTAQPNPALPSAFLVEDYIRHGIDLNVLAGDAILGAPGNEYGGVVSVRAGRWYVTNNSYLPEPYVGPYSQQARVQRAITAASAGNTIIIQAPDTLFDGSSVTLYATNATVDKNLTFTTNTAPIRLDSLTMNASGSTLSLQNPLQVESYLGLTAGMITPNGTEEVVLVADAPTALTWGGGWVNGRLRRSLDGQAGSVYHFPVGTATSSQNARVEFTSAYAPTTMLARFNSSSPAFPAVLNTAECGASAYSAWAGNGIWTLTPAVAVPATYNISVFPTAHTFGNSLDFTPETGGAAATVAKNSGGTWSLDGDCAPGLALSNLNSGMGTPVATRLNLTGFSDFGIAATDGVPYPVEMLSFQASLVNGHDALLEWQTASEQNNQGFQVQRGTSPSAFQTIGWVNGGGTTNSARSYMFTDPNLAPGVYYYRLNQVDFNGAQTPLNVVELRVGIQSEVLATALFPNPATATATLQYTTANAAQVRVTVTNPTGQTVWTSSPLSVQAGSHQLELPATQLASGLYNVVLDVNGQRQVFRLQVVR